MDASGNLDALVARVIDRAEQEAAETVDRAEKAAEREVQRFEEQLKARAQAAEAVLREQAARRVHTARAEAEQAERRTVMNARESAVEHVFATALQNLTAIAEPNERLGLVEALIKQSIQALGAPSVRVRLNPNERKLVLAAEFPQQLDAVRVTLDDATIETCAGPVVTDDAGRVVFENTMEARLDRMRDPLRRLVAETLHLDDEKEGPR